MDSEIYSLSEVVIYDNFNPKWNYKVYLYSYVCDFNDIKSECYIYHHKEGYLEDISSPNQ